MNAKKLAQTGFLVAIAAVALSGVADDVSETYAEEALTRALTTYAVARGLNGVISVAQGTEIALEPGGVGVMLTPGQILDPVNDLVERFSSVMLVAASSLGLQVVLIEILSWWVLSAALVVCLGVFVVSLWSPTFRERGYVRTVTRLALILTMVRFALPVVIIASNFVFDAFLLTKHDTASGELSASALRIEQISSDIDTTAEASDAESGESEPADADDDGFELPDLDTLAAGMRDSIEEMFSSTANWVDSISVSDNIDSLRESAAQATNHIVDLIVIFVLQTIIFPICFLWLFVEALKAIASRSLELGKGQRGASV